MISSLEEITPALFGIKENLTEEAIVKHWALCIQPILNHEEDLFKICQFCVPITKRQHKTRSGAYKVFQEFLSTWVLANQYEINEFERELSFQERAIISSRKKCLLGAFSQYWDIYNRCPYESVDFEKLIQFWHEDYEDYISSAWEDLIFWNSGKTFAFRI